MICLTFDTDHCNAARMREWLATCIFPGRATVFCTEAFPFLVEADIEVAPHAFLQSTVGASAEIERWRKRLPSAICWRPHSLVTSQAISVKLGSAGYRIASTVEMFACDGIRPILSPWGIWEMPIFYMDNSDFNRSDYGTVGELEIFDPLIVNKAISGNALYVFDFHPIHYLLNTPSYAYYAEQAKRFKDGVETAQIRFNGYGTASFFDHLVAAMLRAGMQSLTLPEALDQWVAANGGLNWKIRAAEEGSGS